MSGILIATLLATVSAKIPAGFSSGDLLYSDCSGSRQFVVGYVAGWFDKWNRDEYLARKSRQLAGFDEAAKRGDFLDIGNRYIFSRRACALAGRCNAELKYA
ncbi:hypothetical protein PO860_11355 [Rhizobium sp. BJ04]|uniref:hypothetical protein n=1 Tax=Rhizobium binxianense TaxID=3024242 RepID=UPI0023A91C07|nr:hypothetical protein [Rhizobium sp. BJ04]WEA62614.1 hypothetical protein PO860_11355 [Rhizobium sp. BJ04]